MSRVLKERDAKELLATFGLDRAKGADLREITDAVKTAASDGLSRHIKISSDSYRPQNRSRWRRPQSQISAKLKSQPLQRKWPISATKCLVERMITGAVAELIIGVTRDPQFGLGLVVGAGGVFTELLQRHSHPPSALHPHEIEIALKSLKVWKLIEGFRSKSGDAESTISTRRSHRKIRLAPRRYFGRTRRQPIAGVTKGAVAVDALVKLRTPVLPKGAIAVDALIRMRIEQ